MMKKRHKKIGIICISLLGIVLILFFIFKFQFQFFHFQDVLFDKNTISVETENIDANKITIELIDYSSGVIFKNGKKVGRIKNEYGGDNFKIFYDNSPEIFYYCHF